jgi:ribosomal protein S12 methylthiotransferase accessory factor
MGITRLADITGLDFIGLPVFTTIRPNSRSLSTSQGKGIDRASAKASALMEAVESWHAENITKPLRWESYAALRRQNTVIDVDRLIHVRNRVLHHDMPRLWIEGYDLMRQEAVWVPFDMVTLYFVSEGGMNASPFLESSTGLASGNHLLEAITHGLCEVIERDAEAGWMQQEETVRLDLASVEDPLCRYVLSLLAQARIDVGVWDITSDIDVSAYVCVIMDSPDHVGWRVHGAYSGFGCHLSPAIALLRALTEAVQSRLTFIAGSRDDMFRQDYTSLQLDEARHIRWRELQQRDRLHNFAERVSIATHSFNDDVYVLLNRLQAAGITSVVAIDLTKSEYNIPVVKVLVPGLEEAGQSITLSGRTKHGHFLEAE